jgi:hypothetical protein
MRHYGCHVDFGTRHRQFPLHVLIFASIVIVVVVVVVIIPFGSLLKSEVICCKIN